MPAQAVRPGAYEDFGVEEVLLPEAGVLALPLPLAGADEPLLDPVPELPLPESLEPPLLLVLPASEPELDGDPFGDPPLLELPPDLP
ncbi:hypothetical protein [Acidipila sp. EB88]|uniref:hypothetical protein n=1 Tax=Acidipila sp. EB88 TaxID=2305226 RepID=UPI001F40EADF|nr:hypothetical protein [Acidipila sp. EB88]